LLLGGNREKRSIAASGHYCGTMKRDWLGIPTTGKSNWLRYGEVWSKCEDGRVDQTNLPCDIFNGMRHPGWSKTYGTVRWRLMGSPCSL
jgi:hypothetical protein